MVAVTGATGSESGAVVQRIRYSAYGRPLFIDANGRACSGPTFGPAGNKLHTLALAWQGLPYDLETGITYNRARSLHHRLGRFLQRDPLGYVDGMSMYQYVGSNPFGIRDPMGLFGWDDAWGIVRGVGRGIDKIGTGVHDAIDYGVAVGYAAVSGNEAFQDELSLQAGQAILQLEDAATTTYGNFQNDGYGAWGAAVQTGMAGAATLLAGNELLDGYDAYNRGDWEGVGENWGSAGIQLGLTAWGGAEGLGRLGGRGGAGAGAFEGSPCKSTLNSGACFPAGTLVHTESGPKPIEQVQPGEKAWACDPESGEWELEDVLATSRRDYEGDVVTITVSVTLTSPDGQIQATGCHPFWVVSGAGLESRPAPKGLDPTEKGLIIHGRWIEARHLQVGDVLLDRSGNPVSITALSVSTQHATVYNFAVDRLHTYAVGTAAVLVHNSLVCPPDRAPYSGEPLYRAGDTTLSNADKGINKSTGLSEPGKAGISVNSDPSKILPELQAKGVSPVTSIPDGLIPFPQGKSPTHFILTNEVPMTSEALQDLTNLVGLGDLIELY